MTQPTGEAKSAMQRVLDVVEKVGNKVPHPVIIFLILIGLVIVLSHVLHLAGVRHIPEPKEPMIVVESKNAEPGYSYDAGTAVEYPIVAVDETKAKVEERRDPVVVRSLLTTEGLRFIYSSLVPNFMAFTAVGLMIVAMIGAGVAEESGLVNALIRKLVLVSPAWALSYFLAFGGILSSIAADAGYLVLIPLAGVAFVSVGRHPLAGLALGFAAVGGAFTVNMLIKPLDAVLVEFTNDAIALVDPTKTIGLASNLWFSIASVAVLAVLITWITERVIEPRLGAYTPAGGGEAAAEGGALSAAESRGLMWALLALVAVLVAFALLTLPAGAPLRNPDTGELIGNSPFMNGMIGLIMALFLATGAAYGFGAGKFASLTEVIKAIEKAVSAMGGTIFLFFILSQFVAYFTYTNIGTILALKLAGLLQAAGFPPLLLLIGFIVVVALIDFLITGAIAKWAIFAPIFVPLLMKLGVAPEATLAAYRIADSPVNVLTPLNAYFALVVTFAQKYDKNAGVGTIVSLMLPYVVWLFIVWTALFVAWQVVGLPWGL
jgi:aminobenzoyl-glutamate transport protein